MDKVLAVHQKKATKHPLKPKKKVPVKVVYISNPMKVKTSASQFRALVQQLTGRDADTTLVHTYCATDRVGGRGRDHQELMVPHAVDQVKEEEHALVKDEVPTTLVQSSSELGNGSDLSFDDDVFMPQMLDNFPDFLPSNFWYESTHIGSDEVLSV